MSHFHRLSIVSPIDRWSIPLTDFVLRVHVGNHVMHLLPSAGTGTAIVAAQQLTCTEGRYGRAPTEREEPSPRFEPNAVAILTLFATAFQLASFRRVSEDVVREAFGFVEVPN